MVRPSQESEGEDVALQRLRGRRHRLVHPHDGVEDDDVDGVELGRLLRSAPVSELGLHAVAVDHHEVVLLVVRRRLYPVFGVGRVAVDDLEAPRVAAVDAEGGPAVRNLKWRYVRVLYN